MGFRDNKYFTEEPLEFRKLDTEAPELGKGNRDRFNYYFEQRLFNYLGIDVHENEFNRDKNGNLRIFELTEDGKFADPFEKNGLKAPDLIEKIYTGRVFAFPAGDRQPVQLRSDTNGGLTLSKPLDRLPIQPVKRPNLWQRFAGAVFGAYKKERAAYADWLRTSESISAVLNKRGSDETSLKEEKEQYQAKADTIEAEKAREKAAKEAEYLKKISVPAEQYKDANEIMMDNIQEIYGTKPVYYEKFVEDGKYTKEQFNQLKEYDLSKMDVKGPVTDRQFMSLGFLAVMRPEIGGQVRLHEGVDPEINTMGNNTFYTSDLSRGGVHDMRESAGSYFAVAEQPAREYAAQAIAEYQQGKPEKLGELIGSGIRRMQTYGLRTALTERDHVNTFTICAISAELLDRDPVLMQEAQKAGMTDAQLNAARGDLQLAGVIRKNAWAQERLAAANAGKLTLTEEQRRECIDARVDFELLNQSLSKEIKERSEKPDVKKAFDDNIKRQTAVGEEMKKQQIEMKKDVDAGKITQEEYEKRVIEIKQKGHERGEAISAEALPMQAKGMGIPDAVKMVGKHGAARMAEEMSKAMLPGREKLYDLKGKELERALKSDNLLGADSPYRKEDSPKNEKSIDGPEISKVSKPSKPTGPKV